MSVCSGWSLVKHETKGITAITLWCRSWSCPDCLPHRLKQLKEMAAAGNPTTFLTLTVNPQHGQNAEMRARELADAFKLLMKRMRRKFVKTREEYLAVFEETKRGEPHLHVLMRAPYVPQRWISETMAELISAPIVDIRKVHGKRQVAIYIAKYVGKGPKAFGTLKRYWTSQGYVPKKPGRDRIKDEFGSPWYPVRMPLWILSDALRLAGRLVVQTNEHEIFAPNGRKRTRDGPRLAWMDVKKAVMQ